MISDVGFGFRRQCLNHCGQALRESRGFRSELPQRERFIFRDGEHLGTVCPNRKQRLGLKPDPIVSFRCPDLTSLDMETFLF